MCSVLVESGSRTLTWSVVLTTMLASNTIALREAQGEKVAVKPIASRTLYVVDNPTTTIVVEIFEPKENLSGAYECEIRIQDAPEGLGRMVAGGSDSYQALLLGIKMLSTMVDVFNTDFMDSKLRWHDDSVLDLGFNVSTGE